MKKPPKKGDRVYWYTFDGTRIVRTVKGATSTGLVDFDCEGSLVHYRAIQGRLVPKKKPVSRMFECKWEVCNGLIIPVPVHPDGTFRDKQLVPLIGKTTKVRVTYKE